MARRNVDQQIADLAARDRFQVLDDGVDMPAGDERRGWLDDRPGETDELTQTARGQFAVNLVSEAGSSEQWCEAGVVRHRLVGKNPALLKSGLVLPSGPLCSLLHDVAVAQQILGQEDGSRDVAGGCQAKQTPAHRNPALGFCALHDLAELLRLCAGARWSEC